MMKRWAIFVAFVLWEAPVRAQTPAILSEIGIEQKLGAAVPLDLPFKDETGGDVRLGQYFGKKPVLLMLVYYECPMLCTEILSGVLRALRVVNFDVGREFEVVTVSFDPAETPAQAALKKDYALSRYGREGASSGWHFLTGPGESLRALTDAVGFRYARDPETNQLAHASGIMILTPSGKLSRYFYGIEYSPRDLRLGLVEASANRIGSVVDKILLYCYHYDPKTGRYGVVIMNVLRVLGVATVAILGAFVGAMLRRERRARGAGLASGARSEAARVRGALGPTGRGSGPDAIADERGQRASTK